MGSSANLVGMGTYAFSKVKQSNLQQCTMASSCCSGDSVFGPHLELPAYDPFLQQHHRAWKCGNDSHMHEPALPS